MTGVDACATLVPVEWLIFAQTDSPRIDLARLLRNARAYFPLSVDVLEELACGDAATSWGVRLRVEWAARDERATFRIVSRATLPADVDRARSAELGARGGGLADLAARCRFVWELSAETADPEALRFALTALLASVALGPILPPDGSALYGVRGARERAAAVGAGARGAR